MSAAPGPPRLLADADVVLRDFHYGVFVDDEVEDAVQSPADWVTSDRR